MALAHHAFCVHGWASVLGCIDARMHEVYAAAHERVEGTWRERVAPTVGLPDALVQPTAGVDEMWAGAGNGFALYPELASRLKLGAVDAAIRPTAQAIAELALPRLAAGEGVDAADARPVYVRHRVALTTAERDAGIRL